MFEFIRNFLVEQVLPPFMVFLVLILIPTVVTFIIIQKIKRREQYLVDLGKKYKLSYKKDGHIDLMRDFRSRLFNYVRTIKIKDVFVGEYQNHSFTIFTKLFYSQKSRLLKNFTIASCKFQETEFPHILLRSKKMPLYQDSKDTDTKIFLEQEYLENFDLHCPKDYEIEALQIFTRELISSIQTVSSNFSIEFGGDRFYVYIDKNIHDEKNEKDLIKIIEIVKQIIEKTDGILFRLKDDFEALDEYYKKPARI